MPDRRPNIVFIMPDQLRWDYVGAYGEGFAETPAIDALARAGTVFERCLSPSPVCIPARASMLTGHNSISTGVLSNNYWLRPDYEACGMPTFASLLSASGYHTEAIGKMHFIPWDRSEGFDHRIVAEDKRHIHIRDDYHDYLKDKGLRKYAGSEEPGYREGRMASTSLVPLEHQVDKWVGDESVAFLRDYSEDKPFFLWTAFPGPHDPYNPPRSVLDQTDRNVPDALPGTSSTEPFRAAAIRTHRDGSAGVDLSNFSEDMKRTIRWHYKALVKIIDDQVGAIVDAIKAREDGRETLIVFSSDHGDFLGDFGFLGKVLFFESSMRVPMIVAGNGTPRGRSDALVSLTDVFATFTRMAGLDVACQDSQPLPGIGVGDEPRSFVMGATDKGYMIAGPRWKLSRYINGVCMLCDIQSDPGEQTNHWDDPDCHSIRESLDKMLQAWIVQSILDANKDKTYPYMTMTPDHPGHQRGWNRDYPMNAWESEVSSGLT